MKNDTTSNDGFHDLGEKIPSLETAAPEPAQGNERTHYPSLWFHDKNELKSLPKSGTAIIKYKKVMERTETVTINGKTENRYTTELEIHAIKAGESDESEAEEAETSDEDAIEKGLEAASKETNQE